MSKPTHDTNDAVGGAVDPMVQLGKINLPPTWGQVKNVPGKPLTAPCALIPVTELDALRAEVRRLRAFIASLKAKAQQSIIITPRHFEAFERGETGA
jgi:hypothetical protein